MVTELRVQRVRRGLSQLDVGLRVKISTSRLSMLERGIFEPTAEEAKRVAAFFGMPAAQLFCEIGSTQHPQRARSEREAIHA
jgi:transcriptional regulator with XRE-family HTH domain